MTAISDFSAVWVPRQFWSLVLIAFHCDGDEEALFWLPLSPTTDIKAAARERIIEAVWIVHVSGAAMLVPSGCRWVGCGVHCPDSLISFFLDDDCL